MKKFIHILLAVILMVCGCAAPKTGSNGVSIEPQSVISAAHSTESVAVLSESRSDGNSYPEVSSKNSAESVAVSSESPSVLYSDGNYYPEVSSKNPAESEPAQYTSETIEDIGEPMTQAEFDDFFANVLPKVAFLIGGEQEFDPRDSLEINDVIYYKITDTRYDTVEKIMGELSQYCLPQYVESEMQQYRSKKRFLCYFEKDGIVFVEPKTEGANREFDKKSFFRDSDSNYDTIDLYTIKNGEDPFLNYYFWVKRVDGEWKIWHSECLVHPADAVIAPRMGKPVIYLYPEKVTDVTVKLDLNGTLGCTYPAYPEDGWKVTAYPDGKLIAGGEEYHYLFWEGVLNTVFTIDKGFCVKGADTAAFLKKALSEMGLIPSEYNDFIVYWLPKMENNAYNLISFIGSDYTENAKLDITPKPDSVLRVAMVYQPLEKPIEIAPQTFEKFERNGFTVVEWGGAEIE